MAAAAAQPPWQRGEVVPLDLAFSVDVESCPGGDAPLVWVDPVAGEASWQELLGSWLALLRPELPPRLQAPAYSLGLCLVDDAAIASLNADWRGKPVATDVLAFAAQEEGPEGAAAMPFPAELPPTGADPAEPLELGDIVISLDTAARQAPEHGHGLERELWFLASHGLLHLLGWDHPDEASLATMLARQDDLLAAVQRQGAA